MSEDLIFLLCHTTESEQKMSDISQELTWRRRVIDALLARPHRQQKWLSAHDLKTLLADRGFHTSPETLEKWDQMGVLHPVIRYNYPISIHRRTPDEQYPGWEKSPVEGTEFEEDDVVRVIDNFWSPDMMNQPKFQERFGELVLVPTTDNFQTSKSYKVASEGMPLTTGGVYYHPHQIFRVINVINSCVQKISFSDFTVRADLGDMIQSDLKRSLKNLKQSETEYLKFFHLFCLIEDRYLPRWRGSRYMTRFTSYGLERNNEDNDFKLWQDWVSESDAAFVLEQSLMNIEEIKNHRSYLARKVRGIDPNSRFYTLIRHFPNDKRQQLRDKALLAWDYYEASEMLGWFIEDVTGEKQPHTDDLNTHSEWKKAVYGIAPLEINYESGNILKRVLSEYTVDPVYKVLLIVEGESEEIFIKAWCKLNMIDLPLFGIQLLVMDGIDDLKTKRPRQAAIQAKADQAAVIIVVDDDEGHDSSGTLKKWVDERIISNIFQVSDLTGLNSPIGGLIWPHSFEEDNFTLDELIQAWVLCIRNARPDLDVDSERIKSLVLKVRENPPSDKKGNREKCDSWIKSMETANRQLKYYRVQKTDIAEHLISVIGDRENHMIRLIKQCVNISMNSINYGPPHPSGGFGYPIEN